MAISVAWSEKCEHVRGPGLCGARSGSEIAFVGIAIVIGGEIVHSLAAHKLVVNATLLCSFTIKGWCQRHFMLVATTMVKYIYVI